MVRPLKHHESKLLKKVDFLRADSAREVPILRKYHIQRREDYTRYNRLCGAAKRLATRLSKLDPTDPFRQEQQRKLLEKVFNIGLIPTQKNMGLIDKMTASSFCRRRLPVVMVRVKMAETVRNAVELIEQGHVRVGPKMVTDPAMLITRRMEDFVTWVDTSRIRRTVQKYNDKLDDFDLLAA
mmetsp:Transcript_33737/g.88678  ORF Transcript_33737/g.88678 Transcript_33737/m.88678 type:complete len:182 (+) Transcript_33737:57-602(+)